MKIKDYAEKCRTFVTSKNADAMAKYFQFGFIEEVGELSGKFAKFIRKNDTAVLDIPREERKEFAKEIGDVCWFAVMNCKELQENSEMSKKIAAELDKTILNYFYIFKFYPCYIQVMQQQISSLSSIGGRLYFYNTPTIPIKEVLIALTIIAAPLGYPLDEVMQMNIDKLTDRKKRGVIIGDGDNR